MFNNKIKGAILYFAVIMLLYGQREVLSQTAYNQARSTVESGLRPGEGLAMRNPFRGTGQFVGAYTHEFTSPDLSADLSQRDPSKLWN